MKRTGTLALIHTVSRPPPDMASLRQLSRNASPRLNFSATTASRCASTRSSNSAGVLS
ncbi:hypothetical protein ACFPRL_20105 [Pseudoclavibacter helvolus]